MNQKSQMKRLTLYSKPGCHLCDEMKRVIETVGATCRLTLDVVDISRDAELVERYGLEIPVLMIDGRKAAKYRITERELVEKLTGKRSGGGPT
jgi:glutaredoxin